VTDDTTRKRKKSTTSIKATPQVRKNLEKNILIGQRPELNARDLQMRGRKELRRGEDPAVLPIGEILEEKRVHHTGYPTSKLLNQFIGTHLGKEWGGWSEKRGI